MSRFASLVRTSLMGTWCERHVPSTCFPSIVAGPVQPFGVRMTIIGHSGRLVVDPSRAACWMSRIWSRQRSRVAAICWWTSAGSSPVTKYGVCP
jgi:hypothetical protein